MKKAKKYDAVKEVREIRNKMSEEFANAPEKLKAALKAVRENNFPKEGKKPGA
jgi:hypothetical protein